MQTPHFLRFARSLALGGSVAIASGCGASTAPTDTGAPQDVVQSDAREDSQVDPCSTCACAGIVPPDVVAPDSGLPMCSGDMLTRCCAAIGPLPPPELTA
jgi:hypothetical protein